MRKEKKTVSNLHRLVTFCRIVKSILLVRHSFNVFSKCRSILEHGKKKSDRFNRENKKSSFSWKKKKKRKINMSNSFRNLNHLIHLFFNPSAKIAVRKSGSTKAYPIQLPKKKTCSKIWLLIYLWPIRRLTDTKVCIQLPKKILPKILRKKKRQKQSYFKNLNLHIFRIQKWHRSIEIPVTKFYQKRRGNAFKRLHPSLRIDRKYHATLKSISTSSRKHITGKFVAKKKEKKKRERIQMEYPARRKVWLPKIPFFRKSLSNGGEPRKCIEVHPADRHLGTGAHDGSILTYFPVWPWIAEDAATGRGRRRWKKDEWRWR